LQSLAFSGAREQEALRIKWSKLFQPHAKRSKTFRRAGFLAQYFGIAAVFLGMIISPAALDLAGPIETEQ
jgi:hypothetical protein